MRRSQKQRENRKNRIAEATARGTKNAEGSPLVSLAAKEAMANRYGPNWIEKSSRLIVIQDKDSRPHVPLEDWYDDGHSGDY